METHRKFRLERNFLRVFVFAVGIGITIYCAMLCLGMRHYVAELICVSMGYAVLCGGAWMYKLCPLSWAFIGYTYAVRVCMILQPEGVFDGECRWGSILDIAHYIAFAIGFVLCWLFIYNLKRYIVNEESKDL